MRISPSIGPADRLDREVYLVLEDFGARAGCAWRETDEADADLETVIRLVLSGEYTYPVRIVAFNAIEGWSRSRPRCKPSSHHIRRRRSIFSCLCRCASHEVPWSEPRFHLATKSC